MLALSIYAWSCVYAPAAIASRLSEQTISYNNQITFATHTYI